LSKAFEARFEFDKNKIAQIAARLHEQFYGGKGFFAGYQIPEYILPGNLVADSKETGDEKGDIYHPVRYSRQDTQVDINKDPARPT